MTTNIEYLRIKIAGLPHKVLSVFVCKRIVYGCLRDKKLSVFCINVYEITGRLIYSDSRSKYSDLCKLSTRQIK